MYAMHYYYRPFSRQRPVVNFRPASERLVALPLDLFLITEPSLFHGYGVLRAGGASRILTGTQSMTSPNRASAVPSAISTMSGFGGNDGDSDQVLMHTFECFRSLLLSCAHTVACSSGSAMLGEESAGHSDVHPDTEQR